MTWRVTVEAEAEAEILGAAAWYGQRSAALRERFLTAVQDALSAIAINPLQYQTIRDRIRRIRVRGFRCVRLYSVLENDVIVAVCIHTSRDPKRWQRRLRS